MRKIALILAVLLIAAMAIIPASALTTTNSTAIYATVHPVIDGEIDEIWGYADAQTLPDVDDIHNAYTKLMWTETGLYFLAYVEDKSITEDDFDARNSVDFWVSEMNMKAEGFDNDPGDWHFCKASDGSEAYYTGNAVVYDVADRVAKLTDKGYIIEMFVPYQSAIKASAGTVIGYTVSVNDDVDGDGGRDSYTFWATSDENDAYWANTAALCDVTLVIGPDPSVFAPAEEAPVDAAPAEEGSAVIAPAPSAPATADGLAAVLVAVIASAAVLAFSKKRV